MFKCSRRCDICKKFLVVSIEFTCHTTKRKYKVRGTIPCNTKNITYLITCKCCSKQNIGSAIDFKERFRIHENENNTGKVRCGVANHLLNVCKTAIYKTEYLQVQLIQQVFARKDEDIDNIFQEREKCWQMQLFTLIHVLNRINELYAINRREYRK